MNTQTYSVFDYPFIIRRKHRYLVIESPDFGCQAVLCELTSTNLSAEALGRALLRSLLQTSDQMQRLNRSGHALPTPKKVALLSRRGVSTAEAARILGLTTASLRRLVRRGELPAKRTPGGHFRFSLEELSDYLVHTGARLSHPISQTPKEVSHESS